MEKRVLAASMVVLSLSVPAGARAEDWRPATDYLMMSTDCTSADDPKRCQMILDIWTRDYTDAIAGKYQGQRNVAYCLTTGCDDLYGTALRKNPVLGCAWRVVIINSGHLDADTTDTANLKLYCGPKYLDDAGRIMADAQARTILKKLGQLH